MSTAKEELIILQNIIAKAGGIENVDLHSEFAKSMSLMHNINARDAVNQAQAMNNPPTASPQPPQGTQIDQQANPVTQPPQAGNAGENQGQPMAGKYDAL